jgi:hypothetical protein
MPSTTTSYPPSAKRSATATIASITVAFWGWEAGIHGST